MANKITIIGAGQVGSTIAYALVQKGAASEIVMVDIDTKRAMGEAMDIRQGTPFASPVNIHDGSYEDAKDSNIVVVTSGAARKPGQSRLDLAQTNVNITKSIIPQITKVAPDALYVIVANPVDILTYQFTKYSDIPANHILGSGTMLDTARLRTKLADTYDIAQLNVHAYVYGEHGDSSFVPWSLATIATVPVDKYHEAAVGRNLSALNHDEIEEYVRKSGGIIIDAKKFTNYGIGATVTKICNYLNAGTDTLLTVSTMLTGEYGISDVALSILTEVGQCGVKNRVVAPLLESEITSLRHSADCLKDVIKQLNFD
ncbi:MAG: L-lactate dehydrogenase [Treponema sp.]|nr:L-lactate dehydrogenase [Treponema sp.]